MMVYRMEKKQKAYVPAKCFMIRSPLKSADYLSFAHNTEEHYDKIINDHVLREAIAVSSVAFHNSLKKEAEKKEQDISPLFTYAVRAASRSTPYGLMAGVNMGIFSKKGDIFRCGSAPDVMIKNATIDMEWYFGIVSLLENSEDVLSQMHIIYNRNCYTCGNKIKNPYISNVYLKEKGKNKIRVNDGKQLEYIKQLADAPCSFLSLKRKMMEANPGVPEEVIVGYIRQLIKSEILITEFRKQYNSDEDPLDYLIDFLQQETLVNCNGVSKLLTTLSKFSK